MNQNDNNSSPWGSGGGGSNPWGSGPSSRDFENTIKKAKDRFGKFKFGNFGKLRILGTL